MIKKNEIFMLICLSIMISGCFRDSEDEKLKQIKSYNLEMEKKQTVSRQPCDTIAIKEYVIRNYPAGTHLIEFDRSLTYNIPKPAVLYFNGQRNYVFAVIAKSKPGERNIEPKNVIGYESSFINLDSTKLGTAFFYLTLFRCDNGNFSLVWEKEVPIHGGFNYIAMKKWIPKNIDYIQLNFEDGIISGFRNYNYFFIDGISETPHLLETYEGVAYKRTLINFNNDLYPDYYEYRFSDSLDYNRLIDSVSFFWDVKKNIYRTNQSNKWIRKF
ncbi:MAG: hypothetical protein GXX85_04510 [Ignavibacteria bacterium]|nr:hypothetical protein [Ignavibacteria bacterium]